MNQAHRIRFFARNRYVEPARRTGGTAVAIRAGDIVRELRLQNSTPSVCSALEARAFTEMAGVKLLERLGPRRSTTTEYRFEILGRPDEAATDELDSGAAPSDSSDKVSATDRVAAPQESSGEALAADGGGGTLYLVSCVKTKRSYLSQAKELYTSAWFLKARAYAESKGSPWRILSAKYGAVHPETVIEPYEKTLNAMSATERRAWAHSVLIELEPALTGVDTVVFLAGTRYRNNLEPSLRRRGLRVIVPMEGLSQGRQLSWLNERLND